MISLLAKLALGAFLILAAVSPARAAQAVLKANVVAEGATVTLADLFDASAFTMDPEAARVSVLAAPAPGESLQLDAAALQRFAAAHHVDWPNSQRLTAIKIERASKTISAETIERAIQDALDGRGLTGRFRIRYAGSMPQLVVAQDADAGVLVRSLNFEPTTGQFVAMLSTGAQNGPSATLAGRAYKIVDLPVLARDIKPGETVTARDMTSIEFAAEKLGQSTITESRDIVGKAARQMIRAGEPIRLSDVESPILVRKNTVVTMSMQAPGIMLTAEGRALDDGAKGDAVRVMNTASKRVVTATVESEGTVGVRMGASPAPAPKLAAADLAP